ncbi:hypothetical protein ES703_77796 [subsurface metagenome]
MFSGLGCILAITHVTTMTITAARMRLKGWKMVVPVEMGLSIQPFSMADLTKVLPGEAIMRVAEPVSPACQVQPRPRYAAATRTR